MDHTFNTQVAKDFGIAEAVLIQHLYFWIKKNEVNGRHLHNGRNWTYNSASAFSDLFIYLSKSQISRILKKLEDKDVIIKGNFNKNKFDKTNWYAFSDNGISTLQGYGFDLTESLNGDNGIDEPIPYSKPYSKPDEENYKEIWKKDFDAYLYLVEKARSRILVDSEFREFMAKYYRNVDYNLTLEKSIEGYWGKEEAWAKRKKGHTKKLNMYAALKTAMQNKMNIVYATSWKSNDEDNEQRRKNAETAARYIQIAQEDIFEGRESEDEPLEY